MKISLAQRADVLHSDDMSKRHSMELRRCLRELDRWAEKYTYWWHRDPYLRRRIKAQHETLTGRLIKVGNVVRRRP